MKTIIDFLSALKENNNREWFERNRDLYQQALDNFHSLTQEVIEGLSSIDPTIKGLGVKDCTYRIYRDVRFRKDKTPYKTHMGAYICRGGKSSGYGGYYLHIAPYGGTAWDDGCFMASGVHCPPAVVLKSLREEIYDNGDQILRNIKKAKGFELDMSNSLKRAPQGYQPEDPHIELLKLKDMLVVKPLEQKTVLSDKFIEHVVKEFSTTTELLNQINRSVTYAFEEML